ncbi:MAG: class I SAM-dependent methyltransferase, partial [Betaproteobacteria bacterium]|nr:class I SAM-dependent methyltransferase [Betaproteobacteria bacterium]
MNYVDFGKTASDYGKHRAGFPAEFFWELSRLGIGMPGQRVVDLGTGTGTIARQLAAQGCAVTGIDRSEDMLQKARALAKEASVSAEFRLATAEDTGLATAAYDV